MRLQQLLHPGIRGARKLAQMVSNEIRRAQSPRRVGANAVRQ